jgi:hypothetical protein
LTTSKAAYEERQLTTAKVLNWITGAGTVVALLGLFFVWRTLSATKEAADAAKRAADLAQADERAWVAPVAGNVTLDDKKPLRVEVAFQNIGKTPALQVSTVLDWKELPAGQALTFDFSPNAKSIGHGTVYPNGREVRFIASPEVPTKEQLTDMRSGKTEFYFFGNISYRDIFSQEHSSRLCYVVDSYLATVRSCSEYNEAN